MQTAYFIQQLESQADAFEALIASMPPEMLRWKPGAESWSVTETVGHLLYEERNDFRARLRVLLSGTGERFAPINPAGAVQSERFNERDLTALLTPFLRERQESVGWLRGLDSVNWDVIYPHPPLEGIRAGDFLVSWVAHDLLHLGQLIELKWAWGQTQLGGYDVRYAGEW
jgi:hypothetical protein